MNLFMRSKDWIASVLLAYSLGLLAGVAGIRIAHAKVQDATNVNTRYTVESIELTGIDEGRLSRSLRAELKRRVGEKFHPDIFAELAVRIKQELRARAVSPKLQRGTNAENVKVLLDVEPGKSILDPSRSRIAYHGKQGWSGAAFITSQDANQVVRGGYLNNGDDYLDRLQGFSASYQRKFFRDKVRAGFQFDGFRSQWNPITTLATSSDGQFSNRQNYTPSITYSPFDGIAISTGISFTNFNFLQASQASSLGRGSSQALVTTLRLHRDWGELNTIRQTVSAEYGARIGTQMAGGDYAFRRHQTEARYVVTINKQRLETSFVAGRLDGLAPLPERFVAGNSRILRGWNKYDITPIGATRVIAGSVEYSMRVGQKWMPAVFADTGAVWTNSLAKVVRNSVGGGVRTRDGYYFYVAIPLKEGRIEPQVMTGVNF